MTRKKKREEMSEAEIRAQHQANGYYQVADDLNWDGWDSVAEIIERRSSKKAAAKTDRLESEALQSEHELKIAV